MKKILIVDDEILVRVGIKTIVPWENNGYAVIGEASNGIEAMEKIKLLQPDIVLTDLYMDDMDGFELIQQSKKYYPKVMFVVLSSYNDLENVKRAMKLGAKDYVFKLTIKPNELLKILDEVKSEENNSIMSTGMEAVVRKSIPDIKNKLINLLAQENYLDKNNLLLELKKLGSLTDFNKGYTVLYLSVDKFSALEASKNFAERQLLNFTMENIIQEVMCNRMKTETFSYDDGGIIVTINTDNYPMIIKKIKESYDIIYEYICRYLGVKIIGALSPMYSGVENFSKAVSCCLKTTTKYRCQGEGELYIYNGEERHEIVKMKEYVKAHLSENLNVSKAARLSNMSESYFSHTFKKEVGMSFIDYVNHVRIQRAEELLRDTELRIGEVALQVGIENQNYFSVLFKKLTGVTPNKYRE